MGLTKFTFTIYFSEEACDQPLKKSFLHRSIFMTMRSSAGQEK